MILASDLPQSIELAIPIVTVFGLFVVGPIARRKYRTSVESQSPEELRSIATTQTRILDELHAVRLRLDEVERVLATVD
ncbi:MAG: hypothetical protein JWL70_877 [Acidimicrobiia bacterium]|nr:hypothetical protein [Acidimicrobiia bacterium]